MKRCIAVVFISVQFLFSWGSNGHKIINKNAVIHLPVSMKKFIDQQAFLETHSVDADTRKTSDTAMFSEQYRHYLDIDDYPNFRSLDRNFSVLVSQYGWMRVKGNGTNPWELVRFMDSLTAQLKRGDWNTSYQTAADIGHYVGDPHQPLHAAVNYNGQLTGNTGIHSRYESNMVNSYQGQISIKKDSITYISDVLGFALNYIVASNALVDSVLHADNLAKSISGYSGSGTAPSKYYEVLWQQLGDMTKAQMQLATVDLASLWYTAWVNAGLLAKPSGIRKEPSGKVKSYNLEQNFPNPFNPKTTIRFDVAERGIVKLEILTLEGKQIASLVNEHCEEGSYSADWDASNMASGVYLYRLETDKFSQTKKLLFIK